MTKAYTCETCNTVFEKKTELSKHVKKSACSTATTKTTTIAVKDEHKVNLAVVFKYCLDVLRNNEHLTGDKALRTLAHLLDLRLIESQFGISIDIDTHQYDFSDYDADVNVEEQKTKLLRLVRFSNLAKEKEENIPIIMKYLWDDILSQHPVTKNIFLKGKGFDIQHQSTYKKLIDKLYSFDFGSIDNDILGEAYEEVVKDVMIGKTLGQFFTPPKVKQMMVELIDPQLKPDGTIETIFDPAMGTGGFLITSLRHLIKKSKSQNIALDWDFISNQGLGGREAEPDTYQLAVSNMLIASGRMFHSLEKGDSIRDPITNKYDIILANPPFGIDGLVYYEIRNHLRSEYLPIVTNSAVPLFLQAIIYMLKVDGRCAVVLPEGQELFSKTKALVAVREYLMKTCDLTEVIYLPAGTFTHTTIRTCVFYFQKKKEGKEVVEIKQPERTVSSNLNQTYIFKPEHQTEKVRFYSYNAEANKEDPKTFLLEVGIERICNNKYSLNYVEYTTSAEEEGQTSFADDVVVKTLSEICKSIKSGRNKPSDNKTGTKYPYYGTGGITGYTDEFLFDGEYILTAASGTIGNCFIVNGKFFPSEHVFVIDIENKCLMKYVYYYILSNREQLIRLKTGVTIPNIRRSDIENLKIPIPSLERQQDIVKYLDLIYENSVTTSTNKILELKQLNEKCLYMQKLYGENTVRTLDEICKSIKSGRNKPSDNKTGTKYPYYGTGGITGYTDEFLFDGEYILTAASGTIGNCFIVNGKFFPSEHVFVIDIENKCLMKYVYYYILSNREQLIRLKTGVTIPNIRRSDIENLKIPIPSLERQQDIVKYCEYNDALILQLENEIEFNKKQAVYFFESTLKRVDHTKTELLPPSEHEFILEDGESIDDDEGETSPPAKKVRQD